MHARRRSTWIASLAALVAGVSLLAAGCGGGDDDGSAGGTETTAGGAPNQGKTFANLRVTWDAPDYFDPALSYTVAGWQIMWNVYLPLVGYKHVAGPDGATLVPYLAQELPEISSDGKTYSFTLRPNLKYSNGKPVKASDFKYTIERLFKVNSPGVGFFTAIQGAEAFAKNPKSGAIGGIVVDDAKRTITIKLSENRSDFLNVLATQFASFVPTGTPASDQSIKGIPATGPYQIQNYRPNRSFTVIRNPNYVAIPGLPRGNPDKITAKIVGDASAALQSVLSGNSDYNFVTLPLDRLREVQTKYKDQLQLYTPANTFYLFMNSRVKPFDKLGVRQAINYAIDRNAMVQLFGGLGKPTQNILPPTYPQYKQIDKYTFDQERARQLIQQSGYAGMTVTVYGHDVEPAPRVVNYVASVLNKVGFKAKIKILARSVYFTTIGNQATKAQIGYANWYQDYPHPSDWLDVLFNGKRITETHNNNYSNAEYPEVDRMINELNAKPINDETNEQWAEVDRLLIEKYAAAAPYVHRVATDFFSPEIDQKCYVNHVLYQFDFALICRK